MKQGRTLDELVAEVKRQVETKLDFIAPTNKIEVIDTFDEGMKLSFNERFFNISQNAHNQIGARLKIPKIYYDKMLKEDPGLLAFNVNSWFNRNPETRMIRALDHEARAFLSAKYRRLDNWDMMRNVMPVIEKQDCKIVSCEVNDNRIYIKALTPKIEGELKTGDHVQSGIVISNSETGLGSLRIEPLVYILECENGMISQQSMKKYHVGKQNATEDAVYEILTDETKEKTDEAFWAQVKDLTTSVFDQDIFNNRIDVINRAHDDKFSTPQSVNIIELAQKEYNFNEDQAELIKAHLYGANDYSRWGLAQAITRTAQDQENYDVATDMERIGGKVAEMTKSSWETMTMA